MFIAVIVNAMRRQHNDKEQGDMARIELQLVELQRKIDASR